MIRMLRVLKLRQPAFSFFISRRVPSYRLSSSVVSRYNDFGISSSSSSSKQKWRQQEEHAELKPTASRQTLPLPLPVPVRLPTTLQSPLHIRLRHRPWWEGRGEGVDIVLREGQRNMVVVEEAPRLLLHPPPPHLHLLQQQTYPLRSPPFLFMPHYPLLLLLLQSCHCPRQQ